MAKRPSLASTLKHALDLDNWTCFEQFLRRFSPVPRCRLCAVPVPSGAALCQGCIDDLPWRHHALDAPGTSLARVYASFDYAFPIDRLVMAAKFRGDVGAARLLGALMASRRPADLPGADLVCPVPMPTLRLVRRGYNQALELARPLAAALGARLAPDALVRRGWQRPQSALPAAARRANLKRAFAARGVDAARVLLVDDVMTTGSTLRAAARALRLAGAARIDAWVCAAA